MYRRLDLRDMILLRSAHKACGFVVALWAHLWVDYMWGIAREWGPLSTFSAFRGEGRHQLLKSESRKRSCKGGSQKRGSRLRGGTPSTEEGVGENASAEQPGPEVVCHGAPRLAAFLDAPRGTWECQAVLRKGDVYRDVVLFLACSSYNVTIPLCILWWFPGGIQP